MTTYCLYRVLLSRHRRPSKKTGTPLVSRPRTNVGNRVFGAARHRVLNSADGPQTARLVIQPFQTVAKDIFIWLVGPPSCPFKLRFRNTLSFFLSYLLT